MSTTTPPGRSTTRSSAGSSLPPPGWRRPRQVTAALGLAAVAAMAVGSVATAVGSAAATTQPLDELAYHLQPADDGPCAAPGDSALSPTTMRGDQVVCIQLDGGRAVQNADGLEPVAEADGWWRLTVPDSFVWGAEDLPTAKASFTVADGAQAATGDPAPGNRTFPLGVAPDIGLTVGLASVADDQGQNGDETADQDESDSADQDADRNGGEVDGGGTGNGGSPGDATAPSAILTSTAVTKTIRVTGTNNQSVPELEIREQARLGEVMMVLDGEVLVPAEGSDTVTLDPGDLRLVSYQLSVSDEANFGRDDVTQLTELVVGDVVLDSVSTPLTLETPSLAIDVQALAEVPAGEGTIVSVRVANQRDVPVDDQLEIVLAPIEGADRIDDLADLTDIGNGAIDGTTIVWPIERLSGQEQMVRTIRVDLRNGGDDARIRWRGEIRRRGAETALVVDSVTTDITESGGDGEGVDFAPDQLIRLIAFVMAFALVAVIFGAWVRRTEPGQVASKAQHKHELDLFRAYIEAILVLVILVAILVLALQGGLTGESAASLIGVIAGYTLGRSLGGAK